jgi:hypothetical protein
MLSVTRLREEVKIKNRTNVSGISGRKFGFSYTHTHVNIREGIIWSKERLFEYFS